MESTTPPGNDWGPRYPTAVQRFGFVGLPNTGKSSLYNALVGQTSALAAPYAFATRDPNVGVAKVPDPRLDALAEMAGSREVVPASVQFVDIGGLVEGASKGEGLGNRFLGTIREVDAVVYVLRAFVDPNVSGSTDPLEQLRVLEVELSLADLESVQAQIDKRRKAAKADRSLAGEVEALDAAEAALSAGTPLYRSGLDSEALKLLEPYFLLTNRPVLAVVNVGEDQLAELASVTQAVESELEGYAEVLAICVQLEAETAQLDVDEQVEMLAAMGLGQGALPRFVHAAYHLLDLHTFFSARHNESRAWPFRTGMTAPQCAGLIHTDFQRGFIRAEVIRWDELLHLGSWSKAREVGKVRTEGKDYEVADGDVLEIRFNV